MKSQIFFVVFLTLALESECSPDDRFFISAPRAFHVGVDERVFVQMGKRHLNQRVTLHLEREVGKIRLSEVKTVVCTMENEIKTVELQIKRDIMSRYGQHRRDSPPYLLLVAESNSFDKRKTTRVLISTHGGEIFIQTDQPIYNPKQIVKYRIFTLDYTYRPYQGVTFISVFNPAGNRVLKSIVTVNGGIYKGRFTLPEASKKGMWKITAYYKDSEAYTFSREFKVQKFVLPSFEVNVEMMQRYILLKSEQFNFIISAKYSHGKKVKGAYYCGFGVLEKGTTPGQSSKTDFIKGLELTGSVQNGVAAVSLQIAQLDMHLQKWMNQTLSKLNEKGSQLYLGVFVTNIESGEMQEAEVFLPIFSSKYIIDLSRTRTHFIPKYPLDVVALVYHPDGSPAAGVPVKTKLSTSDRYQTATTGQEGAAFFVLNFGLVSQITVEVSADDCQHSKVIQRASSPSGSYLYMVLSRKIYSVGDSLIVDYNTNVRQHGFIYYMVLSRGTLIKQGTQIIGTLVRDHLEITSDMVPSFRLIAYFYDQDGKIIADSAWVDVRDECEIKVKVEHRGNFYPGRIATLNFDLHGQSASVALLAVDKGLYALHANNRLTAKQLFSSMQSHDLGCSYAGGFDSASVLSDAGLSFISQYQSQSEGTRRFGCDSKPARERRSLDLQHDMITLKANFSDEKLKTCCVQGYSSIPMIRTCQERALRVSLVQADSSCAKAFLHCCLERERLKQKAIEEDAKKGFARTVSTADIELFFMDTAAQYIRRYFPLSLAFTEFDIHGSGSYNLALPDSITTWEIQVVTLSVGTGFCVVQPTEVIAFKNVFVSLRLPYSVKKYEQISISPVIYNYGEERLQIAVHMEQTEGLCSPSSASNAAFVNVTVEPQSSRFVSFSAVPMVTGSIPIKIRLYDMTNDLGIDAIEKTLKVLTEGVVKEVGKTFAVKLDGRTTKTLIIDGHLPDDTVPDSSPNIFFSAEGDGFASSHATALLSPHKVSKLIILPTGCLEQTMTKLVPTASAIRYLDLSDQWFGLPIDARDDALDKLEDGLIHILAKKNPGGSYGSFSASPYSNWLTAFIVKVLSMVAELQLVPIGKQSKKATVITLEDIRQSVRYLLSQQLSDGSFGDEHPVMHRRVMRDKNHEAAMTAFITIALCRSQQFLETEDKRDAVARISRSTTYLLSHFEELHHPYAVAITSYCLAVCMPNGTDHSSTWNKLKALATEGTDGCYLWTNDADPHNTQETNAITIDTAAYALLAAVQLGHMDWAEKTACWLTTQENYFGGFKSSRDTTNALEALAEYELNIPFSREVNMIAEFTVPGKTVKAEIVLQKRKDKVETDLKRLIGNNILVTLTGNGDVKLKVQKTYHLLEHKSDCQQVSINVTVVGKVQYTAKVIENYEYYDDYSNTEAPETVPESVFEPNAHSRNKRDLEYNVNSGETVTYKVCVSHSLDRNLTGMAIADITLLSGFEAVTQDLDKLMSVQEQYISHYEVTYGRVLLYFNELFNSEECIAFDAIQRVQIGLLQPVPAVFYDYYEPNIKCTVFYSAPKRSKLISKLCSEEVCQCAERPCHKIQKTFQVRRGRRITMNDRLEYACFFPTVDYAYVAQVVSVSLKSNFEMYEMKIEEAIKSHGDIHVMENPIRFFAKRRQCKGQLDMQKQYLLMGKDGSTTDSNGMMQYILESNTWVEKKPTNEECKKTAYKAACSGFTKFIKQYKDFGCTQ